MLIALTGTPGTGKTAISKILEDEFKVVHLNDIVEAREYYDEERDSYVVNLDSLREYVKSLKNRDIIIESHYAHEMPVDMVIVLRTHPDELRSRLERRGYDEQKIMENLEAEAMGLITSEALNYYGKDKVFEVDTTDKDARTAAHEVKHIILTRDEKYMARINYMEEILKWY